MKNYEITYLISADLPEEEAKNLQERITSLIQEQEGILADKRELALTKLAYPIKGKEQAYLAVLNFQLNPEKLAGLEKKLKAENQIIRYLILYKKPVKAVSKIARVRPTAKKPLKSPAEKKVELKEIEKKLEEILNEPK